MLAVESLYGRVIGESHPLYRDYRDAIRRRDEDRALAVLRSIVRINPDDPNAQSELARLSAKFLRESLGRVGVLFTEHDMDAVFAHADRILVLVRGEIIAQGAPEEVRADEQVKRVYLGTTGHKAALRARKAAHG